MGTGDKTGTNVVIDLDEDQGNTVVAAIDEDGKLSAVASFDTDIVDEDFEPSDRLPAQAVRNTDGSVTLPLAYPQTVVSKKDGKIRERTFDQLVLHRLNGADQRAIGAAREDMMAVIALAQSAKISQAVMNALYDKMDAADISAAGQVLNHFLASGRKTGKRV